MTNSGRKFTPSYLKKLALEYRKLDNTVYAYPEEWPLDPRPDLWLAADICRARYGCYEDLTLRELRGETEDV